MRRITHTAVAIIVAALAFAWPQRAFSQTSPAEALDLRQVALFKNGLGFFVGQVACPEGRTSFQVALPVAPSHGTFWISYPADLALTRQSPSRSNRESRWTPFRFPNSSRPTRADGSGS